MHKVMWFVGALAAALVDGVLAAEPPVFFFTEFPMANRTLRDELASRFSNISRHSCADEPGVSKYQVVFPRSENDQIMFSIEQYANDAAFFEHLAYPPVWDMISWTQSIPNATYRPISVTNFTVLEGEGLDFAKPTYVTARDPWIVVEIITYKNGAVPQALPYWKDVVASAQAEAGTLVFGVYGSPLSASLLYTLAAYESKAYLDIVHNTSPAVLALQINTKQLQLNVQEVLLQKQAGFLFKDGQICG